MTEHNGHDFEHALRRSLHEAAPPTDPGLANRLLARTAAEPQRRRWSLFSGVAPALAAAAVVALAVVIGLSLGQLPRVGDDPSQSAAPAVTAEPSATPSPSPSDAPTPSAPPSSAPSPDAPAGQPCTNDQLGFSLRYPDDWHTNEPIEQPFAESPTSPCTFFGPEPMEIIGSAGLPPTVAITFGRQEIATPDPGPARLLLEETVTVDGRPATVREWEWTESDPFVTEGDRFYVYDIELEDGTFLVASTNASADGDHEERKRVLDGMIESLVFLAG